MSVGEWSGGGVGDPKSLAFAKVGCRPAQLLGIRDDRIGEVGDEFWERKLDGIETKVVSDTRTCPQAGCAIAMSQAEMESDAYWSYWLVNAGRRWMRGGADDPGLQTFPE